MKKIILSITTALLTALTIGSATTGVAQAVIYNPNTDTYIGEKPNISLVDLYSYSDPVYSNNIDSALLSNTQFGYSSVAKAVLKVWKKLPANVRAKIGEFAGIEGFLNAIDHFTGTEWNVIYKACRSVGMNDTYAYWVTQTITLFI